MIWFSSAATLIGTMMVLQGRQRDLATPQRLEEHEGPTVVVGLGILCLFIGGSLGIVSGLTIAG